MKKENLTHLTSRVNCRAVYGLHYPVDYADHIEKKRDKTWFLKIQQLEKKTQQLREQMVMLLEKSSMQVNKTQQITSRTYEINDRFIQRRTAGAPKVGFDSF